MITDSIKPIIYRAREDRITSEQLTAEMKAAIADAIQLTLKSGVPVFYRDMKQNMDILEQPDGRRFHIRYTPGASGEQNYTVIQELTRAAA